MADSKDYEKMLGGHEAMGCHESGGVTDVCV